MISFVVSRNGKQTKIRFPCSEDMIHNAQYFLQIPYNSDVRVTVDQVITSITDLKVLEGQEANLDFLNLLGRALDGMACGEIDQFKAGLWYEKYHDIKDIINLTQSVSRYSLIDENDLYNSGKFHKMDLYGCISAEESKTTDFAAIAKELLDTGKCKISPYGKIYINEEIELCNWFDGKHMPAYYDRDFVLTVSLSNGKETEFLFLPCDNAVILRAANRLGCCQPDELKVTVEDEAFKDDRILDVIQDADINTLNDYSKLFENQTLSETEKHVAVIDYIKQYFQSPKDLRTLLNLESNIDCFTYVPNATTYADVGRYLIADSGDYNYDPELDEYYDFAKFGKEICDEEMGKFTEAGMVGINDYQTVRPYLQNNGLTMGGM